MAQFLISCPCSSVLQLKSSRPFTTKLSPSGWLLSSPKRPKSHQQLGTGFEVKACCAFFNPDQQPPLVKEALKEPVAFMGGVFAGLLRLDLNEDPLKDWLTRTVEASTTDDDDDKEQQEETPQQIEIE